jgi:hypothetical protein
VRRRWLRKFSDGYTTGVRLALALVAVVAAPPWTAQGTVTALHKHSITVHGHTCRLEGEFGDFVAYRWAVGDGAKIVCSKGILRKITVLPLPSVTVSTPSPTPRPPATTTPTGAGSFSISASGTGGFISAGGAGMTVSAISGDSITVAMPFTPQPGTPLQSSYTCGIGPSSPPTGLQVGDRVTRITCSNGVLTELTRG